MTPNSVAFTSPVVFRRLVQAAHSDARVNLQGFLSEPDSRETYEVWSTVLDLNISKPEQSKSIRHALIQAAKQRPELRDANPGIQFSHYASGAVHMGLWLYGRHPERIDW